MASTDALMLGPDAVHSVNVHAVVLLSILDHHARRSERAGGSAAGVAAHQDRALGVLLGSVNAGVVEVSSCFGVLHLQQESEVCLGKAGEMDGIFMRGARVRRSGSCRRGAGSPFLFFVI